jgi:hypothetical protein
MARLHLAWRAWRRSCDPVSPAIPRGAVRDGATRALRPGSPWVRAPLRVLAGAPVLPPRARALQRPPPARAAVL